MSDTYELSCDCGRVRMTATGQPKLSLMCHCESCRELYSADILGLTGWDEQNVTLPDDASIYHHKTDGKEMHRYGCPNCGMILYGRHRPGIPVIRHNVFRKANGGTLPDALAPTLHLFYGERVLDIDDDLEKCDDGSAIGL